MRQALSKIWGDFMKVGNRLTLYIVLGLILVIAIGSILSHMEDQACVKWTDQYIFNVIGQLFLNMIFMMVVPVVFISIVLGVYNVGDAKTLGSLGIKTLGFYLVTTAIAITIAIVMATVVRPGAGQAELLDSYEVSEYRDTELEGGETGAAIEQTFDQTLINIIPTNIFDAMATDNMLQIIAFAIFIGIAMISVKDKIGAVVKLFEQANEIVMWIVMAIMKYFAAIG